MMNETEIAGRFAFFTLGEVCHIFYSSWQGELLLKHSESIFDRALVSNEIFDFYYKIKYLHGSKKLF